MTPVSICSVISQNQNQKFKQKSLEQKSCDDFNVTSMWHLSVARVRSTLRITGCGQHCVLVNDMWRDFDQSRAGILRWSITNYNTALWENSFYKRRCSRTTEKARKQRPKVLLVIRPIAFIVRKNFLCPHNRHNLWQKCK